MAKISVLMAAYNETKTEVDAALTSLIDQSEPDFEVCLVLDAPQNQPLLAWLKAWAKRDSRIHLLVNPKNLGLAASLNRGIKAATAPYLARMDADDISEPMRFEKQLAILQATGWDVLSANASFIDENDQPAGEHNWIPQQPAQLAKLLPHGSNLIHPSVMMKASAIRQAGGYRLLPTAEDYDLWLRLLKQKAQIGATNEKLLRYRLRGNSMTQGDRYLVFLVSSYLQAAYQRQTYPDAQTQQKELAALLAQKRADDPQVKVQFNQRVKNLSAGKKALAQKHVARALKLVLPALGQASVRAYARQSAGFAKVYQALLKENQDA